MAEREVKAWITVNGNHIPIFEDGEPTFFEQKKEREIKAAQDEADKRNKPDKYAIRKEKREKSSADIQNKVNAVSQNFTPDVMTNLYKELSDISRVVERLINNTEYLDGKETVVLHNCIDEPSLRSLISGLNRIDDKNRDCIKIQSGLGLITAQVTDPDYLVKLFNKYYATIFTPSGKVKKSYLDYIKPL